MIIRNAPITVGSVNGVVYNFNSISKDSISILSNGDLLLTGFTFNTANSMFHTVTFRLDLNGNMYTSYGLDGVNPYDITLDDELVGFTGISTAIQSNGQALIVGDVNTSLGGNLNTGIDFGLLLLNADGSVDKGFVYPVDDGFLSADNVSSVTVQLDDKILIAGHSTRINSADINYSILRLNKDGTLDSTFNGDGKLIQPVGSGNLIDLSSDVLVQADGKILITGTSYTSQPDANFSIIRLNSNGTLDNTFSGDGKAFFDVGGIGNSDTSVAALIQADNKILIAGYSATGINYDDFSVIRLNTDGSLDASFSGDGKVLIDVSGRAESDFAQSMALQADGKILIAGYSFYTPASYFQSPYPTFSLIRLNTDGSLDNTFNGNGKLHFDSALTGFGRSIVVQDDGKILLGGSLVGGNTEGFALIRINADGSIDSTFGSDVLFGDASNNILNGSSLNDTLIGQEGDDTLIGGLGNDRLDGGVGNDIAILNANKTTITEMQHLKTGGALIKSDEGTDTFINIETLQFLDGNITFTGNTDIIKDFIASRPLPTFLTNSGNANPTLYSGPVAFLEYEYIGSTLGDVVTGATGNDFMNLGVGDDAANGGAGDDVLDGGIGSNFLTGGGGNDTLYLDGRGGTVTWATITDFNSGDAVNIWGWNAGTSKLLLTQANAGAVGFTGVTFHYDLNNDNSIDTSITFTGLSASQVPASQALSVVGNGYLLIA